MKIEFQIPDYDNDSLDVIWEDAAEYTIDINDNEIVLKANSKALLSFAKQMLYLAYQNLPTGSHIHYDEFFTKLQNLKYDFIIEKL